MNFLIDTHVFIWLDIDKKRLSKRVIDVIEDVNNTLYLSLVSVWEMQIKIQLGKLQLNNILTETLGFQQQVNRIELLPIELSHILALNQLPYHHNDPFDRLLIAQAQIENLTLITDDSKILLYGITCFW
ncbi:MAG: type II toxin-antitoxin system VapC family toxin [bacterium]|nr:type II toxin-antitoxin system VapC family toxin [bacterium]